MSGHSKWHSIRHKKAAKDEKRGKVLTKHSKVLMVLGQNDSNPETNASLRNAIINAKADGVPKDNIERILKKLSGEGKGSSIYSEQVYEGFGPEGIPFVVTALTDNTNRTYSSIRTAFMKNGGILGNSGSVMFMFNHIGVITIKNSGKSEEALFELAIDAGADNFEYEEEVSEILTVFTDLGRIRDILSEKVEIIKSEPQYRVKDPIKIVDKAVLERIEQFIEAVEEADDIDEIFGGFEVDSRIIT